MRLQALPVTRRHASPKVARMDHVHLIPRLSRAGWLHLRAVAPGVPLLCTTFAEHVREVSAVLAEAERLRVPAVVVDVDALALVSWCARQRRAVDAAAMADFARASREEAQAGGLP